MSFAETARREGLLALDDELAEVDDDFTRKGLQLVVDGTDPELVREILDIEIEAWCSATRSRRSRSRRPGGFAPDHGHHRHRDGPRARAREPGLARDSGAGDLQAFIATLYGVGSANVIFLPVASKLK